MRFQPTRLAVALAPLLVVALAGCSTIMPKPNNDFPMDKPVASSPVPLDAQQDVLELTTEHEAQILEVTSAETDDPLPATKVGPVAATGIGNIEALRLLLDGTGYSLSIEGDIRSFEAASNGSIRLAGGPMNEVAEELARSGGFFLSVRGNKVTASATKRFILEVPHLLQESAGSGLESNLRRFGARDIFIDTVGNTLTFDASRTSWASIDRYITHMRTSKPMLVYEMEVYQVELKDGAQTGVGITSLAKNAKADPSNWSVTRGSDLGAATLALVTHNISLSAVVNLLQSQGTVSSLARPRLALLSGASSKFRVGETNVYVSKISRTTSTTTADAVQTSSSETAELKTGFELGMSGTYQEGTVFTDMKLKISALVRFNDTDTFGTVLHLPDTTEKEMETTVRTRPGDLILLGGMRTTAQNDDRSGGTTGLNKTSSSSNTEVIIAMRPRIVRFVTSKEAQQ